MSGILLWFCLSLCECHRWSHSRQNFISHSSQYISTFGSLHTPQYSFSTCATFSICLNGFSVPPDAVCELNTKKGCVCLLNKWISWRAIFRSAQRMTIVSRFGELTSRGNLKPSPMSWNGDLYTTILMCKNEIEIISIIRSGCWDVSNTLINTGIFSFNSLISVLSALFILVYQYDISLSNTIFFASLYHAQPHLEKRYG